MPRVGFWRKDIEDWHWLKSWYRFHKIFTKCLRCVSHLVTCLSPSGGSRCLEFFYALVSTQQKSFNAGSKLSVDTTVNKRVEERITVSIKIKNKQRAPADKVSAHYDGQSLSFFKFPLQPSFGASRSLGITLSRSGVNFSRVQGSNDEYVPVHKSHHTDWVNESRYRDKGHLPTA